MNLSRNYQTIPPTVEFSAPSLTKLPGCHQIELIPGRNFRRSMDKPLPLLIVGPVR